MTFNNAFQGATVLVTGNTGFKGTWLTVWLCSLGARVIGLSKDIPSDPSHYSAAGLDKHVEQIWADIRNLQDCEAAVRRHRPDFVFHLAAQPLVRRSYSEPHETFASNMYGTLNVLEALRAVGHACTAVFITSDKCYDNVEQIWGYRENDRLGGKDPYSASKGAAELVIRSYAESFFRGGQPVRLGVGRAGNVIGGGDWAEDRIIPDAARAWSQGRTLAIRNPLATRPWQHVLEPLAGYLTLAARLSRDAGLSGEAFNFGPALDQNFTVSELLQEMQRNWPGVSWQDLSDPNAVYEAGLLKLCCDKALHRLGWGALLTFAENAAMTVGWYQRFYAGDGQMWDTTQEQIAAYQEIGRARGAVWAR